jgi:hypothetical protein
VFGFLQHIAQGDKKPSGGVFGFLHDTATGIVNTGKNSVDVVNAARQGTQGLFQASVGAVTHNPVAEQNAINKTQAAMNYSLNASRGAVTPEEIQSGNIIKPIIRNVAAIAPLVVPVGKIAEGASLPMKFLAKTTANAGVGAAGTAATEQVDTGHINAGDVAKNAAIAGGLGALSEAVPAVAHVVNEHTIPLNEVGAVGKLTPDDLNKLSKATSTDEVVKALDGKVDPAVIKQVAPAILETKDPGIIDNILTRATTPKIVDTSVPPPIMSQDIKPVKAPVKPDAEIGQKTLTDLAMQSKDANEFHQKLQALPEDPHVRAAFDKSGATDINDLYNKTKAGPFQQVLDAINGKPATKGQAGEKGIASARAEQNELLSHERGQRFGAVDKLGQSEYGVKGYFERKAALKGEYTKVATPLNDNLDKLSSDQRQSLFTDLQKKIYSTPDSVYEQDWKQYGFKQPMHAAGAKFNTETATAKVLGLEPGLPTDSEIRLLRVHSPELADIAKDSRPKFHSLMDFASKIFTNVAGTSRAAKATLDFSMGGRQGIFVAARHPVEWFKANKESVKFAANGQYYKDYMDRIGNDDWIKQFDGYDTGLQGVKGQHEEVFAKPDLLTGHIAKDVLKAGNLVAGAERAYEGGLSYLRGSLLKSRLMKYGATPEEAAANLGPKGMEGLAEVARTLTGRGGKAEGWVTKHATSLNEALFSPRLWASRLQVFNPAYWSRIGPAGRAEAFQNLAAFASVAGMVLSAAAVAGAEVETDARSSDFLKIKVGDTRYDILGGFQQNLVFGWRELTGEKKSSTTGAVTKFAKNLPDEVLPGKLYTDQGKVDVTYKGPSRLNVATDLVGNKLTPALASAANFARGQDKQGQPINPYTEIGQLFVPISIQGTYQTIKSTNSIPEGILRNSPDYFGISAQTYGVKDINVSGKQKDYINELQKKNAPADQIAATKLFFQTVKTVPPKTYAYGQIDKALANGDEAKAITLANAYNSQFSKAFTDWRKQYGKFKGDPVLQASYQKRLITDDEFQKRIDSIKKGG